MFSKLKYFCFLLCTVLVLSSCVKDSGLFDSGTPDAVNKSTSEYEEENNEGNDPVMFGGEEPGDGGEGEGDGITDDDDEEDDDDGSGITDDDDGDDDDDDNSRKIGG